MKKIYHLQRYVEGCRIQKCEEHTIKSVAKTVAQMHKLLAEQKELEAGEDRFSLMALWEKGKENCELLAECLEEGELSMRQLEQELGELEEVEQRKEQLIHGDLGIWNMIENADGVYVIDFGESHLGNPYLDIAAVLTSMLGLQKDERKWKEYIAIFCETYEQYYRQIDRLQLRKAIRLWFVRGMLAILNANDMAEEQKKRIIRYYIKQMNSRMIL